MILLHPYAQKMRNGMPNPKTPTVPWWAEVIKQLPANDVVQIGVAGEYPLVPDFREGLPLPALRKLISESDLWIAVDSFFPHLAHQAGKPGIVIWSRSDPVIYGYGENTNLLKDRAYLRTDPFGIWEAETYLEAAFVEPQVVAQAAAQMLERRKVA